MDYGDKFHQWIFAKTRLSDVSRQRALATDDEFMFPGNFGQTETL